MSVKTAKEIAIESISTELYKAKSLWGKEDARTAVRVLLGIPDILHALAQSTGSTTGKGTERTTLPDALLDDGAISPMAKMAYWYLKRHGGDVLVSDMAGALRMDRQNPWVLLIELGDAGWIDYPTIAQQVGEEACEGPWFTVHEVPAVKR